MALWLLAVMPIFFRLRQRTNHARTNMRLSGTGGTLDRKHAAAEVWRDTHCCGKDGFVRFL
jgi:hypothetical protein